MNPKKELLWGLWVGSGLWVQAHNFSLAAVPCTSGRPEPMTAKPRLSMNVDLQAWELKPTQRAHLTTSLELSGPQNHDKDGLLGPMSFP